MSTRISVIVGALVASIALLAATLMMGAPAGAARVPTPPVTTPAAATAYYTNYYGAISLAMTGGAVGWSYDYATKWQALRRAQNECKSKSNYPWSCQKIAWVRNGCLAVAVRWNGSDIERYGWAVRETKRSAYLAAKAKCGYACVRRAHTCTSG